ncbi:MAG: DUF2079 domain-containing protein [Chloroflexi bacterium]|nr:MAG: DUF2079 domain-containing protein [Chloroflexota bacterium]
MVVYVLYFSWYTINRHNTLNSYAADLSLIDQPMWNTVRGPGGFMELTWGDHQQPRLAEHLEPVLLPLSLLFFLWDDVRILLVAQTVALALGAWPVYRIARHYLSAAGDAVASWVALLLAAVYLLSPHLQAANIADFHADPFFVTPFLFAVWYALRRRWGWMWVWAGVCLLVKETLPAMTAMLGLWLVLPYLRRPSLRPAAVRHGLALAAVSTAWFLAATFLVVAPLARQYFGTAGPIYFASRYQGGLAGLPALLQDPDRWRYLLGLLASVGFLPLLAPDLLLLGLPVLVANMFSSFPGQYSGEQHYSAPLVAVLLVAAACGLGRLYRAAAPRVVNRQPLPQTVLLAASLWLAGWSLGYHALHGWTPLSLRVETYRHTPASRLVPALVRQIPPHVPVSASAGLHPHVAHRQKVYVFPTVQDARYLLVDVTDIPGVHPNDARARLLDLLNRGWQVLAAEEGLVLARREAAASPPVACASGLPLPCPFYSFARARSSPAYPLDLAFGDGRLVLLGYDVLDDPDDGVTFRFYWRTAAPLPEGLRLLPLVYDDFGRLLAHPVQVPMIAAVWYPPAVWSPGETVVTETLPQLLPGTFHLGMAVGPEQGLADPQQRWPVLPPDGQTAARVQPGRWVQIASFKRQGILLTRLPPADTLARLQPQEARFGPAIRLTGFAVSPDTASAGAPLTVLLRWQADASPAVDYTVFVHLVNAAGQRVAQHDGPPAWLSLRPTGEWSPGQVTLDSHTLQLPPDLPPGEYRLQVGLYRPDTLARLPLLDGPDFLELGKVWVR